MELLNTGSSGKQRCISSILVNKDACVVFFNASGRIND